MARILSSDGLVMNQANGNAYMRVYARGKNDVGPFLRFSVSGGNPHVHLLVKTYFSFTQTNGSTDFNSSSTSYTGLYCDTSGNMSTTFNYSWQSGAGIYVDYSTSNRQADIFYGSSGNGGFAGRASICCEIFCDRWDYVSVSNL